jgi:glutamine amidotransferase
VIKIVIVDYGMGNIYSVQSALNFLGFESIYSSKKEDVLNADKIILPGVGSFRKAMENIKERNLDNILREATQVKEISILGICLGMQLLGISGTEDGFSDGLGLFDGKVERFSDQAPKIPHVGFNGVEIPNKSTLYNKIENNSDFYFVHSYRMVSVIKQGIGMCSYGEQFIASFEKDNIFGTQFHPEKSQMNGMRLLKNFLTY